MKEYKIRLLPSAYEDIKQARQWYSQHSARLPKQFTQQLRSSIEKIQTAPFAYAVRYKDVHIANLKTFPYAVHFIVDVQNGIVVILAIHHTAISPAVWRKRLK